MMSSKRYSEVLEKKQSAAGFTLVELMIALVLGLVVIAGVGSVFLGNQEAYRTNEGLSEVQDSARTAFEYLVRDTRAAGSNVCGVAKVENILNQGNGLFALDEMTHAVEGWDDLSSMSDTFDLPATDEVGEPVAGAPLVRLTGSRSVGLELVDSNTARSEIKLDGDSASVEAGAVLMLCDVDRAVIFQATAENGQVIEHDADGDKAPGNSVATFPDDPRFAASAYLAVPTNYLWYIGKNDDGGHSLYRHGLGVNGLAPRDPMVPMEMVRGFKGDWKIRYHVKGEDSFAKAADVTSSDDWDDVDAIRFTITAQSRGTGPDDDNERGAGTDRKRLERTFTTTVAIRNRMDAS